MAAVADHVEAGDYMSPFIYDNPGATPFRGYRIEKEIALDAGACDVHNASGHLLKNTDGVLFAAGEGCRPLTSTSKKCKHPYNEQQPKSSAGSTFPGSHFLSPLKDNQPHIRGRFSS
jgi:hypothetical protein